MNSAKLEADAADRGTREGAKHTRIDGHLISPLAGGEDVAFTRGLGHRTEAERLQTRLAVAAHNSYLEHCGPRAVECAEADLLGRALDACRLALKHLYNRGQWDKDRETWKALESVLSEVGYSLTDAIAKKAGGK
jgi:hypothetical protein